MSNYTLTYSQGVDGWVSFYSYYPDFMIGMNSYFYTFKAGNLYRHNTNSVRNQFYGVSGNSQLTSVFNQSPLENKLFKTLSLQGDDTWTANLETDLQTGGQVLDSYFEKKEQAYFAFIRTTGATPALNEQYAQRSLNGIGRIDNFDSTVPSAVEINYSISPLISIGSIISIGDYLYYALPPSYSSPLLFGQVTDIIVNLKSGINRLIVDATIPSATIPPIQDPYSLYIKNSVAESHGILGHYCKFVLTNTSGAKIELFATESEVMKSYP